MLINYLPEFVREYEEVKEIMNTDQKEIDLLDIEIEKVFNNQFILFCDEYGISRFENLLGIVSDELDTLESRKSRVLVRWNDSIPYTFRGLKEKLRTMCGDGNFSVVLDGYKLFINVVLPLANQIKELEYMLDYMIPCNLLIITNNKLEFIAEANFYAQSYGVNNIVYNIKSELNKQYKASCNLFDGYNFNKEIIYEIN